MQVLLVTGSVLGLSGYPLQTSLPSCGASQHFYARRPVNLLYSPLARLPPESRLSPLHYAACSPLEVTPWALHILHYQ